MRPGIIGNMYTRDHMQLCMIVKFHLRIHGFMKWFKQYRLQQLSCTRNEETQKIIVIDKCLVGYSVLLCPQCTTCIRGFTGSNLSLSGCVHLKTSIQRSNLHYLLSVNLSFLLLLKALTLLYKALSF